MRHRGLQEKAPIEVEASRREVTGRSCAHVREPGGRVSAQGRIAGFDVGDESPMYLREASLAHVLRILEGELGDM